MDKIQYIRGVEMLEKFAKKYEIVDCVDRGYKALHMDITVQKVSPISCGSFFSIIQPFSTKKTHINYKYI